MDAQDFTLEISAVYQHCIVPIESKNKNELVVCLISLYIYKQIHSIRSTQLLPEDFKQIQLGSRAAAAVFTVDMHGAGTL